ncbi:CHASE domain-containing protein [Caldimonas brevitalea]|uniref:histidine kinase n=1 Tax=Caldimonas brevitalea TaxID=413882 RepID=A0A0G3BIE8_9BURK|nr:CHASE domain-containing protein [Caldimonas brevitalea]AKJ29142.1 two-component sensor histidine kinase [Caldimonas brevitalea]
MKSSLRSPYPWVVLLACLGLTLLAANFAHNAAVLREQAHFNEQVEVSMRRVGSAVDAHLSLLVATRAFIESAYVSRESFATFVSRLSLRERYPGVQGIGYSPRVRPDERTAVEQLARREGVTGFKVVPEGRRDPLFTVLYLEPADARNRAALGYDMYSEPLRREAMERAALSSQVAATDLVTLKQEIDARKQPGFLVFLPLYHGPAPAAPADRMGRLRGFVFAPFRAHDFFAAVVGTLPAGLELRVYSRRAQPQALLYDRAEAPAAQPPALQSQRVLDFGGQQWLLQFAGPREGFEGGSTAQRATLILLLGCLSSALLFGLVLIQVRAGRALERAGQERGAALDREKAHRTVAETLSEIALSLGTRQEPAQVIQRVTDEATRLTGASFGAYFQNTPDDAGHYGLYTLSGAPREAFAHFPPLRPTPLFGATFSGQTVRLDDVTRSELFGRNPPYQGMPAGHLKVVSYLGVSVKARDGRVLGGLFLGHPEPGRFRPEHERLVEGLAAQAAVVLENAQLLQSERQTHRLVEDQKALLDLIIEQSGEAIIAADAEGVIRLFNPAAERLHGVGRQEVPAAEWHSRYGLYTLEGSPLPLAQTPLYLALHGQVVQNSRWRVRRPDGVWRTLLGTATPLQRADGSNAGAVLIAHDDTERLHAEQEREALLQALERSNQELDQFAYVASHDLKAPLRGLANLSQWIAEDLGVHLTPQVAQHLQLLQGRVHRMDALIDGILQYSRAGRTATPPQPVDVGELITEVLELLSPPPGVVIETDASWPVVRADRTALQQVFLNLVGNAVKHAASPSGHISLSCRDLPQHWEFSITDNGPGIAPAYHERIWGIFQTLQPRDKVEGAGIGLAVVRKLVESRGGQAWVRSEPGHGATFGFTWPKD